MGAFAIAKRGRGPIPMKMAELIFGTGPESIKLHAQADEFARRAVFQEDPGAAINHLLKLKSDPRIPVPLRALATFTAPFMRTPSNILRQGLEFSPAGFALPATRQEGRAGAQGWAGPGWVPWRSHRLRTLRRRGGSVATVRPIPANGRPSTKRAGNRTV
jgi:hypothetical protein